MQVVGCRREILEGETAVAVGRNQILDVANLHGRHGTQQITSGRVVGREMVRHEHGNVLLDLCQKSLVVASSADAAGDKSMAPLRVVLVEVNVETGRALARCQVLLDPRRNFFGGRRVHARLVANGPLSAEPLVPQVKVRTGYGPEHRLAHGGTGLTGKQRRVLVDGAHNLAA